MAKLTDEVKKAISEKEVFTVATCSEDGIPNVVYVKYLKVVDAQTVLIADNYFNKTRDNIINNGKVSFVVLDEEKGSFQIKGSAERKEQGPEYDKVQQWVPERLPGEAAVILRVTEVYNGADPVG